MVDILRLRPQDDERSRLADLDVPHDVPDGLERNVDGNDSLELPILLNGAADRQNGLARGRSLVRLGYDRLMGRRGGFLIPRTHPRVVTLRERCARRRAAIGSADVGGKDARTLRHVRERPLHRLTLGHCFLPVHRCRFDSDAVHLHDLVDGLGIMLAHLVHASLLRLRQRRARHRADDESHDEENYDERDSDAQEHLRLQFHKNLLVSPNLFFIIEQNALPVGRKFFL